jgi:hypothetical protein
VFRFEPFVADLVQLVDLVPSAAVTIHDVSLQPRAVSVLYAADSAAVLSGQIATPDTPVEADLRNTVVQLDFDDMPLYPVARLHPGLQARASGPVGGTPRMPTVAPSRLLVRPTRLSACVADVDLAASTMTVQVLEFQTPPPGRPQQTYVIELLRETQYGGAASSPQELDRVFHALARDERLFVQVTAVPDRAGDLQALAVRSAIQPRLSPGQELWPPNHRMVTFDLACDLDLVDDRGNPLDIQVEGITQDEPVLGKRGPKTAPDAEIVSPTVVRIRAERDGKGNGRVYVIRFTTTDLSGQVGRQQLTVIVPHDQSGRGAVDDGQQFDSTQHR